jgi:hypothetical protein
MIPVSASIVVMGELDHAGARLSRTSGDGDVVTEDERVKPAGEPLRAYPITLSVVARASCLRIRAGSPHHFSDRL